MYIHAQGFENNHCHIQVLKTAASFYGHAKLFQCQRWFAMILNEKYFCKRLTCQLQILLSKFWHKGTKMEQTTWMIGTPRSRWKTHVGSARASVGCRAPPSLLHQGDRLSISLKVVTQCSSISVRSQTTPLSWSLFGIPWCLEDRSPPRRSSERRKLKTQTTSLPYLLLSLVRKPCDTHSSISKLWYHWVRYSNCEIQMAQTVWWLQAHVDVCVSGASFCVGLEIK